MSKLKQQTENRAPFTRDEIIREVRLAALGMASQIAMFGPRHESRDLAARYLGVELDEYDYERDGHTDLEAIPIEAHFLYTVVMDAYDHAYQCSPMINDNFDIDERCYEVAGILAGFPQADFHGEPSPLDRLNPQKLRQVLDTFIARWTLDTEGSLTVTQLALLADMGEAAVRTSLSAAGIKTVASRDGKNQVLHPDALSWLAGRRNFVPTRNQPGIGIDPSALIAGLFTAESLTFESALERAIAVTVGSSDALAAQAGLERDWLEQLLSADVVIKIDVPALEAISQALGAPVPLFVGRAVTALLSRRENLATNS